MKKPSYRHLSFIAISLVLSACNDPKEANEHNFKVAAQSFLDATYPLCLIQGNFPTKPNGWDIHGHNKIYDEMVTLGLLSKNEVTIAPQFEWHKPTKGNADDLTDEGKKYYKVSDKNAPMKLGGFCVGKAEVNQMTNFTQPAEMMGKTVSDVQFTYTVSNLPTWILTPSLSKLNPGIQTVVDAANKPAKLELNLMLTGKGWMEVNLFNQNN